MIDTRRTLTNLHNKFPNLPLDDLFEILDCYVECIVQYDHTGKPIETFYNYGNPTCTATANFEVPQKCD